MGALEEEVEGISNTTKGGSWIVKESDRRVGPNYFRNMPKTYIKHAKKGSSSYQSQGRTYKVLVWIIIEGQKTVPMSHQFV